MAHIAFIDDFSAIIGTDTLLKHPYQEGDKEVRPLLFSSSTFQLPQFKSCFVARGHQAVATSFFLFVMQRAIGVDVQSIIKLEVDAFSIYLTKQSEGQKLVGAILLIGLNTATGLLEAYELPVNRPDEEMKWTKVERHNPDTSAIVGSPGVEMAWEAILKRLPGDYQNRDLITEVIKVQREEDDARPIEDRMGIAGEIIVTQLGIDAETKRFSIFSEVTHTWGDYSFQLHQLFVDSNFSKINRDILKGAINPRPLDENLPFAAN